MGVLDIQETLLKYTIGENLYFNPIRSSFVIVVPLPFSYPTFIQNIKTLFIGNPDIYCLCFMKQSFLNDHKHISIFSDPYPFLLFDHMAQNVNTCNFVIAILNSSLIFPIELLLFQFCDSKSFFLTFCIGFVNKLVQGFFSD